MLEKGGAKDSKEQEIIKSERRKTKKDIKKTAVDKGNKLSDKKIISQVFDLI